MVNMMEEEGKKGTMRDWAADRDILDYIIVIQVLVQYKTLSYSSKSSPVYRSCGLVEVTAVCGCMNVLHEKDDETMLYCCFSTVPVSDHVLPFVLPSFHKADRDRRNNLSEEIIIMTQCVHGTRKCQ